MRSPKKLARLGRSALLLVLAAGCSAPFLDSTGPEQVTPPAPPAYGTVPPTGAPAPTPPASDPVQRAAYQEPAAEGGKKEENGKEAPKEKLTLPLAVALCVNNNFRVLQEAQKIQMAEADLKTASLIPNPTLFADCQLIPLQTADIFNQLGPPQWDALVTIPIDWWLFGKRLAAMQATRLGMEVSRADFANQLRVQLANTVDAFYEILMDEAYFKLAEKNLEELEALEKVTVAMRQAKQVGDLEVQRIKLAVHEALLDRHDRELALELARARLRPFLGRTAADPDYEVTGSLKVTAVVPPPELKEAVALAEAHRPDLIADRRGIEHALAVVEQERRKARPVMSFQPGWSYQDQRHINGFRNGSMFDIGVATTLPITDRNQGNIRKAQADVRQKQFDFLGDRADVLADVEASVRTYADAVEHLTQFNTPETLKAAYDLRRDMEIAYRKGTRPLFELLNAHQAYNSRLAHVIEFESTYWRALYKLNAAVGLNAYDPERGATQPVVKGVASK